MLTPNPWKVAFIVALALAGFQTFRVSGLTRDLQSAETSLNEERTNHQLTKSNYALAQQSAQELESFRLARVTEEQQRITDNVESNYARRIAELDQRLRAQAESRTTAGGPTDPVAVPGVSNSSCNPDETTRYLIQLDELITWAEQQQEANPPSVVSGPLLEE